MSIEAYKKELTHRELTESTKKLYLRAVKDLLKYAGDKEITKDLLIDYKADLLKRYATSTANTKITIVNNYLDFINKDLSIKQERVQKSNVLDNVLTDDEFWRIINFSKEFEARTSNNRNRTRANIRRIRVVMLILYYTGIRISELPYVTVEAVKNKHIDIYNKGKHRRVAIVKPLEKVLKQYIKDEEIETGSLIVNKQGKPISRSHIFRELKNIGGQARGIRKDKIYPHSFRHLFAKQYLAKDGNTILGLADVLGHSSLETTRIYSTLTTKEQREAMER